MKLPRMVRLGAAWLALAAVFDAGAATYAIRLARPFKAGQKYDVSVTASQGETTIVSRKGDSQVTDRDVTVRLSAAVEVLEIDARGHEVRALYTIRKCERTERGKPADVVPAGAKVTVAAKEGRKTVTPEGGPLSREAQEALELVLTIHTGDVDDDDVFGTRDRKAVGESWPVNGAAAIRGLDSSIKGIKPENVKGAAKLDRLMAVDGRQCLQVSGDLQVAGVAVPAPAGMTVATAGVGMKFAATLPMEVTLGRTSETSEFALDLAFRGIPGSDRAEDTFSLKKETKVERQFTYPAR